MDVQGYLETIHLLPRRKGSGDDGNKTTRALGVDSHSLSITIVLVSLGFMYSVHNLIAPNMTAIARLFHMNNYERDAYIGGELTLFFYFPGVLGALFAGVLSGILERRLLFAALALVTSVTCLITTQVSSFEGLAWARAFSGLGIGGSLPVVYSLVGDWYPASRRASATAYVTAASGAGVFAGQCIATLMGSVDWRWPFLVVAVPSLGSCFAMWYLAEEPVRGGQEDGIETLSLYQDAGYEYVPAFSSRHVRALMHSRTNLLVILQAFPGNIPWGVIIVYLHDFLVQDLGLSRHRALGAITTLAGSAFAGILTGGFIGEALYGASSKYLAIFGGFCNMVRALPFFLIFGWAEFFGPLEKSSEFTFFLVLMIGGFVATLASPCTGAMLLNVNLPETRGSVMAMYSVLDDLSKGFGTLFVSMIVRLCGGRAVAYQISLLLWVGTGAAFFYTWYTYSDDEEQMRRHLDEAAMESMVLISKQRAQQAIRDRAKAAGAAHFAQRSHGIRQEKTTETLQWPSKLRPSRGFTGGNAAFAGAPSCSGSTCSSEYVPTASNVSRPAPPVSTWAPPASSQGRAVAHTRGRPMADRERLRQAAQAAAQAAAVARGKPPAGARRGDGSNMA